MAEILNPYAVDDTTLVSVTINGTEYKHITQYCYDSDILQLGDPFSVILPDPHNSYQGIAVGQSISLNMASPQVSNGNTVPKITGVVTQVMREVTRDRGTVVNVAGADLGYHLTTGCAPIWKRLPGSTFQGLFNFLVDPSWGFKGFSAENDTNRRIKMSGDYKRATVGQQAGPKPPVVQIEPGDTPADIFIQYAKLSNKLVNVSVDGYLQLFTPFQGGATQTAGTFGPSPVAYQFYNYAERDRSNKNNVISARLTTTLESRWNKAVCVGTNLNGVSAQLSTGNNPNANSFRGTFTRAAALATNAFGPSQSDVFPALPFNRLVAFADPDRLTKDQANARAKWKIQRGEFDSWIYEITVRGHAQNGVFFEPDNIAEVHDTTLGVNGPLYISSVRYARSRDAGTTTTLQLRQPGLLGA